MSSNTMSLVSTPSKALAEIAPGSSRPTIAAPETIPPPSPGTFRHPRLTEILARQSTSTITNRNIQNAFVNLGVLALTFILSSTLFPIIQTAFALVNLPTDIFNPFTALTLIRFVLALNIALSLRPALPYTRKDNVTDIPLTPSQRSLLGLDPSATPTSNRTAGYITPPRYRRSSGSTPTTNGTPLSADRRSISANYSSSPLSTSRYTLGFSPSPSTQRMSGSPAALPGSPLFHKAVGQKPSDFERSARSSFGGLNSVNSAFSTSTNSLGGQERGLSRSQSFKDRAGLQQSYAPGESTIEPGTPSPSHSRVKGVNYKWLYEKGGMTRRRESLGF